MKTEEIRKTIHANVLSLYKGTYTAKWCYFYRNGMTQEKYIDRIKGKFPNAKILESGDHWHSFVGGAKAGSSQDSYIWVKFELN
jgi:hypothetical protein